MTYLLVTAYPWIKALHVISVILWMGTQSVLPLLLAEHRGLPPSSGRAAMLARLERRLIRRILNPAIVGAFVFGGTMVYGIATAAGDFPSWLGIKLALAVLLSVQHGLLVREIRHVAAGRGEWGPMTHRIVQWLNFILMALVVVLVVAKPHL